MLKNTIIYIEEGGGKEVMMKWNEAKKGNAWSRSVYAVFNIFN